METSNQVRQKSLNRKRVRRYRESLSAHGRVRLEVYVTQEQANAIRQMAADGSTSIKSITEGLLRTGLRIEEQIPATLSFWRCIQRIAGRYQ